MCRPVPIAGHPLGHPTRASQASLKGVAKHTCAAYSFALGRGALSRISAAVKPAASSAARAVREAIDKYTDKEGVLTQPDVAAAVVAVQLGLLMQAPTLSALTSAEYPTPARRPASAILDCTRLQRECGITQPDWASALTSCLQQMTTP